MLLDFCIPKNILLKILQGKNIDYLDKWKNIHDLVLETKKSICLVKEVDLSKYFIQDERDRCSVDKIDPFCKGNKLIMTLKTFDVFADNITTLILNNKLDLKVPKNLNRFQGFSLRENEIIYITDKDFKKLL